MKRYSRMPAYSTRITLRMTLYQKGVSPNMGRNQIITANAGYDSRRAMRTIFSALSILWVSRVVGIGTEASVKVPLVLFATLFCYSCKSIISMLKFLYYIR